MLLPDKAEGRISFKLVWHHSHARGEAWPLPDDAPHRKEEVWFKPDGKPIRKPHWDRACQLLWLPSAFWARQGEEPGTAL